MGTTEKQPRYNNGADDITASVPSDEPVTGYFICHFYRHFFNFSMFVTN